jgi:hypothetical protein
MNQTPCAMSKQGMALALDGLHKKGRCFASPAVLDFAHDETILDCGLYSMYRDTDVSRIDFQFADFICSQWQGCLLYILPKRAEPKKD